MSIARELGSLLSGLLAPQSPAATRQTGKNLQERSRASNEKNQRPEAPAQAGMARDRITLSSASRSLLETTQTIPAHTDAEPAGQPAQPGQHLALPYLSGPAELPDDARSSATAGMPQHAAVAESPATRQMVRTAYGSPATQNTDSPAPASRIDLRA